MTPGRAAKWDVIRRQGRGAYIWRIGILRYGLGMGGAVVGFDLALLPIRRWPFFMALYFPICLGLGFLFGLLTWHTSEWSYARHQAKHQSPDGRSGAL